MPNFRYQLQKYNGKPTRFECPQCHKPQCFSRYMDTETQEYIHESVGKCNHISSCGYHFKPKEYYQLNPTAQPDWRDKGEWSGCNSTSGVQMKPYKPIATKDEPPCEHSCINFSYVKSSQKSGSNFEEFLFSRFPEEDVRRVIGTYHLGRAKERKVIFWQIDFDGKVRTGKVMDYNPQTGKNTKYFNWIHAKMVEDKTIEHFNLRQCIFGEHLLARFPDKPVVLVEGYKNAILVAILLPNFIVVAVDNKSGFRLDKVSCLKGRNVIVFADLDAHDAWTKVVVEIKAAGLCNIVISPLLKNYEGVPLESIAHRIAEEDSLELDFLKGTSPQIAICIEEFFNSHKI